MVAELSRKLHDPSVSPPPTVNSGVSMTIKIRLFAAVASSTALLAVTPALAQDKPAFTISGRIYGDYVSQDVDRQTGLDFKDEDQRIRTARLAVEGDLPADWSYKAEVSYASAAGEAQWEDLYLQYDGDRGPVVRIGSLKMLSFENVSSSRYTTFMERGAFADLLDIGRVMTVAAIASGPRWTATAAITGDSINGDGAWPRATEGSDVLGVSGRVTYAAVDAPREKLHLGAWARYRERQDDELFVYRNRNNSNFGPRYISSGGIGSADTMLGLEGLYVRGHLSLQGEWAVAEIDRQVGGSDAFQTYYASASWFITGEMRKLDVKKGALGRTKVLRPVGDGGFGAFEVALRYDAADLTDIAGVTTAGEYAAWTVGANWHLRDNVRLMANYTRSENDLPAPGVDVDVETLQFRAQYDF